MTPLAGYAGAWLVVVGLYSLDPLQLDQLSLFAWLLLGLGALTFVGGYAVAMLVGLNRKEAPTGDRIDSSASVALRRLWLVCLIVGTALFAIYAFQIASAYGFGTGSLTALRIDLSRGPAPAGFYFFVFAEPLVPLSIILAMVTRRRALYVAVGSLATISLLSTTGRANSTFALLWAFSAFAIYQGPDLLRPRLILTGVASLLIAFAIFQGLGDTIGKSYQNSYTYARFGDRPPIPAALVGVYLYLEGPLPTFSAIVRDTDSFSQGRYTFRPLFQVLAVADRDVQVPPHVQDFKFIPYPFNLATYLSSFYRDFGVIGVLLGPAVIGLFVGFLYNRWRLRRSPATLCLAAFGTVIAISSVSDLPLLDFSRVLEVTAVLAVAVLEMRVRPDWPRTNGAHEPATSSVSSLQRT